MSYIKNLTKFKWGEGTTKDLPNCFLQSKKSTTGFALVSLTRGPIKPLFLGGGVRWGVG